jgi:hypothetical protein
MRQMLEELQVRIHGDAGRIQLDRQAAWHRLQIAENNPRATLSHTRPPVYCVSGGLDPVGAWSSIQNWFRKHCPALRECIIIRSAEYNVLNTAPEQAAAKIFRWTHTLKVAVCH